MNKSSSCAVGIKCLHFWDAVAAKTLEQVEKGIEYYEHVWQSILDARQTPAYPPPTLARPRHRATELRLPLPLITQEEVA